VKRKAQSIGYLIEGVAFSIAVSNTSDSLCRRKS
jgi:hypothetical protein